MLSRTTLYSFASIVAGVTTIAACSSVDDEQRGVVASALRQDPSASPQDKVSCLDHGLPGSETAVDLGGVNRVLDLGDGLSITVFNSQPGGQNWNFEWTSDVEIVKILIRSGNDISEVTNNLPATSGKVTRADAIGDTNPGLNRIGFCWYRPTPPDAGPPPPDAGPPPPRDGGMAW